MATEVTLYSVGNAVVDRAQPDLNNHTTELYTVNASESTRSYEKFQMPEELRGKRITSARFHVYLGYYASGTGVEPRIFPCATAWDPETVTWNTKPAETGDAYGYSTNIDRNIVWREGGLPATAAVDVVKYGLNPGVYVSYHTGNASSNKPYLVAQVEESTLSITDPYPGGGRFVNDKEPCPLRWRYEWAVGTVEGLPVISAVMSWSADGTVWNEVPVSGSFNSVTVPAGTFPAMETIQWKVSATVEDGRTFTSATTSFTTIDSLSTAAPVSPKDAFVDGDLNQTFAWTHTVETGTAPTGYDLQLSVDQGATWEDLQSGKGPETSCVVPAGSIPGGTIYWRVRTYNSDEQPGAWSGHAEISVKAAPPAPKDILADGKPFLTVSWTSGVQRAYQIQAGGYDSGLRFGTEQTHQIPLLMEDGPLEIRVRVQNVSGVWSLWGTARTVVENRPGEPVSLQARARGFVAALSWETAGRYARYLIYRDGSPAGETTGNDWEDQRAAGPHAYRVLGVTADGYYTASAPARADVVLASGALSELGSGRWIVLDRLRGERPVHTVSAAPEVAYTFYSGRRFPVAEVSGHEDRRHSFRYTVPRADALAILEMQGKAVLFKHRRGDVAEGVLDQVEMTAGAWADVSFQITRVDGNGF